VKAIILAAGHGSRMRPLTDTVHKTLLRVGDATIIDRIVSSLHEHGIDDVVVGTGYRADELTAHLKANHDKTRFTFVHNDRYRETNNIFSLALVMNAIDLDDDVLLIESDLVYEPSVIGRIIESRWPNVALLDRFRHGMDGTVVTASDGVITSIIPPHLQGASFDFSDKLKTLNIYKFSREFCENEFRRLLDYYAKTIDDNCYYELILGVLIYIQKAQIHAEILDGEEWSEVDDPNDLRVSEFVFNKPRRLQILEETFGGYWVHDLLDFAFLRNMYFPPPSLLSELRGSLPDLVQNYGSRQQVLNEKLAYFLLCAPEHVNLLNGASQLYPLLRRAWAGKRVLMPSPTFGEYTRMFPDALTYDDRVGVDLDEAEAGAAEADVVVFVNPNNPTGSFVPTEQLHAFAARHPDKTVLVDESFIDFAGATSVMELLVAEPLNNVIVMKSLSKALGVPGLRLGFSYAHDAAFNELVADSLPIWNVNSLAEFLLEIALKHRTDLSSSFEQTRRDRDALSASLGALPFVARVHDSAANFLLVELSTDVDVDALASTLAAEHGVYVKDVSAKLADGKPYLRLAVRFPDENARLVELLSAQLGP
jgi:histidinol-phosphate/aromatic aminotransferase/cobyric acid decarboxylase-like protein/choline kinase